MLRLKELFENQLFWCFFFGFCGFLRGGLECDWRKDGALVHRGRNMVRG